MPAHPNFILPPGTQVVSRVEVRGTDGKPVHRTASPKPNGNSSKRKTPAASNPSSTPTASSSPVQTAQIEANLLTINAHFNLPHIPDLISRKLSGPEQSTLPTTDLSFHEQEYHRLRTLLEEECHRTSLPDAPTAKPALNDLLLRLRKV